MIRKILKKAVIGGGAGLLPLIASAASDCELNGQPIDCAELTEKAMPFVGLGLGLLAFFVLLGILFFIFWLWMLIHAASKPIENKVLWIVLMIIIGVPVSLVYYFVVKRRFVEPAEPAAPTVLPAAPPAAV